VLAINGKPASFTEGGEFPYPTVQGGASNGAVTLSFREFGIRLNFLPRITPRGTIDLIVNPEVSALDFANGLTFQGNTVPALSTRKISTEVELESGQSFVIAGLLDNTASKTLNKIPGLSALPLLGKLFQTASVQRSNSELLVLVTPEIVRPIPVGQPLPSLKMDLPFMESNSGIPMTTPTMDKTGPVPVKPPSESMPLEELVNQRKAGQPAPQPAMQPMMLVPVPAAPAASGTAGQTTSPPPGGVVK
jgi:pilus assembly protein CpaC